MLKHTLNIGLFDKDTLKQEISTAKAEQIISKVVGDCTIKQGNKGTYTMANGQQVIEPSLEVIKYGGSKKQIRQYALELKQLLNQESIYLDTVRSNSELI